MLDGRQHMLPTPSAASQPLGERTELDTRPRSVSWLGAGWSIGRRVAIVLGAALLYAALFVPLARAEGRFGAA
jgi:hypothetical protein